MRREREAAELAEAASIRGLQKLRAQAEAEKAAAQSRARNAALEEHKQQRLISENGWTAAMSRPSVPLDSTRMWSSQLMADEDGVRRAATDAARAESELKRRAEACHLAEIRADAAEDLARRARKNEDRQRDEVVLQDNLDRHLQRRGNR